MRFFNVSHAIFALFFAGSMSAQVPNLCEALKNVSQDSQNVIDAEVDFAKELCSSLKDAKEEDYGSVYRTCAKNLYAALEYTINSCNQTTQNKPAAKLSGQKKPQQFGQFLQLKPAKRLRVVQELESRLGKEAVVVIFGAPGSGKTEQMELALQNRAYTLFDLRNTFLNAYFEKNNIVDAQAQADIKKKYDSLKNGEAEWISSQKEQIIKTLAAKKENIIVFDEFDMGKSFIAGSPGVKSAETVIEIAKKVREAKPRKKVIFIIHEEGLGSEDIARAMKNSFAIDPLETKVIRTGYITPAEEKMLLAHSSLSDKEKTAFMKLMQGHPSAYLPLIKKMAKIEQKDFTYQDLVENAKTTIKKVYAVMEKIQPGLIPVFKEIAQGNFANVAANKLALINSGFVNTNLSMSEIVKMIILNQDQVSQVMEPQGNLINYVTVAARIVAESIFSPQWAISL